MTAINNERTAIQVAALRYVEEGFSILPAFSPSMVAPKEQLEVIRSSPHRAARLYCHLLSVVCKQPLRVRFVMFPISDRRKAEKIFTTYGNANILIKLGRNVNLMVLDVDDLRGDEHRLKTPSVVTERGQHFYFQYTDDFSCTLRITETGSHLQGDYWWANAPPSEHGSGKQYAWIDRDLPLAPLPEDLSRSRNALIYQSWLILPFSIIRNAFYGLVLFPALKKSAPVLYHMSRNAN